MTELPPLPRTAEGLIELQIFIDPIYGSERHIQFKPHWVVSAENKLLRTPLIPWRKFPTTRVQLRSGRHFIVSGYWAEQLMAARQEAPGDATGGEETQ